MCLLILSMIGCKLTDNSLLEDPGEVLPEEEIPEATLEISPITDEISSTNESSYSLSGLCSNIQTVQLQVGAVSTSVSCTNNAWSANLDLSSVTGDPVQLTARGANSLNSSLVVEKTAAILKKFEPIAVASFVGTTVAGSADGIGAAAGFSYASGITSDGTNLYVSDRTLHVIKKITVSTGEVITIAGIAGVSGAINGPMQTATFNGPVSLTYESGNLYVADTENHRIRKINLATQTVETFAGDGVTGSTNGIGTAARFNRPHSVASDGVSLWISDTTNRIIRRINISTREVTTFAGTAGVVGTNNAVGASASFNWPNSVINVGDYLYVQEIFRHCIRRISKITAEVTTVAGVCGTTTAGSVDGVGAAAKFNRPSYITSDGRNLYVTDSSSYIVRKVTLDTFEVTTITGTPGVSGHINGTLAAATFINLVATFYFSNRLYISAATYIREIY